MWSRTRETEGFLCCGRWRVMGQERLERAERYSDAGRGGRLAKVVRV